MGFLRRVPFCGLIRFIGITGGVQDLGVEPRYLAGEIPRKFQHPLTSYNFSLGGYNGEVLWRSTATEERLFLRFYKVKALSFKGPLVFCGSETRGIVGVEESRDGIHSADSTLGKGPCDIKTCQVERS